MKNALAAKIKTTPIGLDLSADLSFEEWSDIASSFGTALQTAAWCIGDWMLYGERKWGRQLLLPGESFDPAKPLRIGSEAFDMAIASTGLDRQTLSQYASVCRKIPREERRIHLSFGHHRALAVLPTPARLEWFALLDSESKRPTVKRLALSLRIAKDAPRIVTAEEIASRPVQCGHDNYVPHLTHLVTILRKMVPRMDTVQRDALKTDSAELLAILSKL